ncbi:MAG: hypothetical protein JWO97_792, partial [Acidobacteria bacterium]|nr:hypothetical protein [Acidobacteriota bacterium]
MRYESLRVGENPREREATHTSYLMPHTYLLGCLRIGACIGCLSSLRSSAVR